MRKFVFFLVIFLYMSESVYSSDLISMAKSGTPDDIRMLLTNRQYAKEEITRALYFAIENNPSTEVMEILIKAGANININLQEYEIDGTPEPEYYTEADSCGRSPLSAAGDDLKKVEVLLKHGADPNEMDCEGDPLILLHDRDIGYINLLLKYNVDLNMPIIGTACPRNEAMGNEIEGAPCTALEYFLDKPELAHLLLDHGAHTNRLIYSKAIEQKVPESLLKRLDPTIDETGRKKDVSQMLIKAVDYFKQNDSDKCNEILDDIHRSFSLDNDTLSAIYYLKSMANLNDVDYAEKSVRLGNNKIRNHIQYISALMSHNGYAKGIKASNTALKMFKDDVRLYLYKSICLIREGKHNEAKKNIDIANSLKESALAYFILGELNYSLGNLTEAENYFKKAVSMGQKGSLEANLTYQSNINEYRGDLRGALSLAQASEKANKKKSQSDNDIESLGDKILMPLGLINPARDDFSCWRANINRTLKKGWIGYWEQERKHVDAREYLIYIMQLCIDKYKLKRDKSAFMYLMSYCGLTTKDNIKYINQAIKLVPTEYVYLYRKGEIYFEAEQYEQVIQILSNAITKGQKNALYQNYAMQIIAASKLNKINLMQEIADKAMNSLPSIADQTGIENILMELKNGRTPKIAYITINRNDNKMNINNSDVHNQAGTHSNDVITPDIDNNSDNNQQTPKKQKDDVILID